MWKSFDVVIAVAFLGFCAGVGSTLAAQANLAEEANRAEEAWVRARTSGDKSAYASLLDEGFLWTFVNGRVENKQQSVGSLQAGRSPITSKDITVYENAAVVTGTAKLTFNGRPITERFVRVWAKRDGVWRAVLFQTTETP